MDLILWRHAEVMEAAGGTDDLERALTPRGVKQAARMAAWLDRKLPEGTRVICSPARRCEQMALALGRKYKTRADLAPGATAAAILQAAQWPDAKHAVLVVGHQPVLGETLSQLLGLPAAACPLRKAGVWWLRSPGRDGSGEIVVLAAHCPETV